MTSDPVVPKGDGARLRLRVSPNAKSTALQGLYGDTVLESKVAAPPLKGKADAEAERFLGEKTGASPSGVHVVRSLSGKGETVFVDGVGAERSREVIVSQPR